MKKFLKIAVPLLLAALILLSIGWYFFQYNTALTRDVLLQQARRQEEAGNHDFAVWLYNLAYEQFDDNDQVAIELAQQFKAIGNYTKAEFTLSKAIEDGGSVELYTALCQTYVEQNKLRDAVRLLDNIRDPDLKAQMDVLRPKVPEANIPSGSYMQYFSVSVTAPGSQLYVSINSDYPSMEHDGYTGPIPLSDGQNALFAVSVGENGLVSPLAVYTYLIESVVEKVTFVDSAVEEAVRIQLGVDSAYVIYTNDLWDITEFTVPAEASSCDDLKWMVGLESVTIYGGFQNLNVLSGLTQLQTVSVSGNVVSDDDLQVLAALPLLRSLTLEDCRVSSIVALKDATGLVYLNLNENAIRDISPLAQLPALQELHLRGNALINLADLTSVTTLQVLDAAYNSLATTSHVAALTNLTYLDVSANDLMKLEGIDSLVNLEYFAAAYNNLVDVKILSGCTRLITLDVSHNTLLDINVIAQLTSLRELDFSYNEVTTLPTFSTTCALEIINGSYNALASLDRLSKLENLKYVYMNYADCYNTKTSLTNVNALQYCPNLVEVHVYGTGVRKVSTLTNQGIIVNYTPL